MIGVFDSGLGGMQTLRYLREELPDYDFFYLGDTLYVPYGERSTQWIQQRTFACLEWLFAQGCTLVILACNTASAHALRAWQQQFPDRKVLSVTVPGVEALVKQDVHRPLLLATEVTIHSDIYPSVLERAYPHYPIVWTSCAGRRRVDALERGDSESQLKKLLDDANLDCFVGQVDSVLLGCTHYPLLLALLRDIFPTLPIINPAREAAHALRRYLEHHPEIEQGCMRGGSISGRVTGDGDHFAQLVTQLWGSHMVFTQTHIGE